MSTMNSTRSRPHVAGRIRIPSSLESRRTMTVEEADEKWRSLEGAIQQIRSCRKGELFFQALYTIVYNISQSKYGDFLYAKLKEYFLRCSEEAAARLKSVPNEAFLQQFHDLWVSEMETLKLIKDIFMYFDKHYIPKAEEGRLESFALGMSTFREVLLGTRSPSLARMQDIILDVIRKDRNDEHTPEKMLLRGIISMLLTLGKKRCYEELFEKRFLEESSRFFRQEAAVMFDGQSTIIDFLRKVQKFLQREKSFVLSCLSETTAPKINDLIVEQMICTYQRDILMDEKSGFVACLAEGKLEDLSLMYDMLTRVEYARARMVDIFGRQVKDHGMHVLSDEQCEQDPVYFVEAMISLRKHYLNIVFGAFRVDMYNQKDADAGYAVSTDEDFLYALRQAMDEVLKQFPKAAEYLSIYLDQKLRRGRNQSAEHEYEELFENCVQLFRSLPDKDVFERYHKSHLANRLLSGKSNEYSEQSFLSKLKELCGNSFTHKMEGMFHDLTISKDLSKTFKQQMIRQKTPLSTDFTVQVLTTGHWPSMEASSVSLPESLTSMVTSFGQFYCHKHSGRLLSWRLGMGSADVRLRGEEGTFDLDVTTIQMCILLCFNRQSSYTIKNLCDILNVKKDVLGRNLLTLCFKGKSHARVLIKEPHSTRVNSRDIVTFNPGFRTRGLKRVKFTTVARKESKEEKQVTMVAVQEDRKWEIDAALVRVMKQVRRCDHSDLIGRTTELLRHRFVPDPKDVKKRIESLIDRDFLSRDGAMAYFYVA